MNKIQNRFLYVCVCVCVCVEEIRFTIIQFIVNTFYTLYNWQKLIKRTGNKNTCQKKEYVMISSPFFSQETRSKLATSIPILLTSVRKILI